MRTNVSINTKMIIWAIQRAGYDVQGYLAKYPRVDSWIKEERVPTVKQLEAFSHKVHVPFGYLLMQEPPSEHLPIPFFRTLDNSPKAFNVNVYETIILLQRRQAWLKEYLIEHGFEKNKYVGSYNIDSGYGEIASDIRKTLGLTTDWARKFSTWEKSLEFLAAEIEKIGITIVFNSVVENNTSRPIKVEECRGFVLVDEISPFMFINSADGKAAQMFTIVHELAHIWIGESAGFDFRSLQPANDPIELLCDKVAAEFLVPEANFSMAWAIEPDIKKIARSFKVSPIVVGRRAFDLGKISKEEFFDFYNDYIAQITLKKQSANSGGDFYATARKRISITYAAHINNAVRTNKLLYRDANVLTGLKGDTYS